MTEVAGPLHRCVDSIPSLTDANLATVVRRLAAADPDADARRKISDACLRWATGRGQPAGLVAAVWGRRQRLVQRLARHQAVRTVTLRAQWRLVVGAGGVSPHEWSLALYPPCGLPYLPASSLKGVTRRYARPPRLDATVWQQLFGTATDGTATDDTVGSQGRSAGVRGAVMFLDALPAGRPVVVEEDVLTPHAGPYYANPDQHPPAGRTNPTPVGFVTVADGRLATALVGPDGDTVDKVARLLAAAVDELGVGAKTAAGYGYLDATVEDAP